MTRKHFITIAVVLLLLYGLFTIGAPFLLALIGAIFLETPILLLMKGLRINRASSAIVVCALFTLVVLGIFYLLGLKVVTEVVAFWDKLPVYLDNANNYFKDATVNTDQLFNSFSPEVADQLEASLNAGLKTLIESLNSIVAGISAYFINVAKTIPGLFVFFIVFIIALFMFCIGLPGVKNSFLSLFDESSLPKVENVLLDLRGSIFGFLRAQVLLSALTYVITLVGLLILGVEYPLAIALLIIIVDILPVLGTGSVLVPWAVYSMLTEDSLFLGLGLLILFAVITLFRRIVEPKIVGASVGIGALSVLISMYIGFKLVGVVGLFLGPIVVIVYQAMRRVGLLKFRIKLE
ncbi:sporulation integral membrane protein YtvI [Paenibacillus sp. y28]|uniref:sporulation integral membrane protein YtvI n=1 Tax=Paenibacillus sp. y28 TaxID=3129110 RepID=UPI0030191D72